MLEKYFLILEEHLKTTGREKEIKKYKQACLELNDNEYLEYDAQYHVFSFFKRPTASNLDRVVEALDLYLLGQNHHLFATNGITADVDFLFRLPDYCKKEVQAKITNTLWIFHFSKEEKNCNETLRHAIADLREKIAQHTSVIINSLHSRKSAILKKFKKTEFTSYINDCYSNKQFSVLCMLLYSSLSEGTNILFTIKVLLEFAKNTFLVDEDNAEQKIDRINEQFVGSAAEKEKMLGAAKDELNTIKRNKSKYPIAMNGIIAALPPNKLVQFNREDIKSVKDPMLKRIVKQLELEEKPPAMPTLKR